MTAYIGLDIGTSGCRAVAIDGDENLLAQAETPMALPQRNGPARWQSPRIWWEATVEVLNRLAEQLTEPVEAIGVDGTSGTVLLADEAGHPLSPGLMYNDARAVAQAQQVTRLAPRDSAAHGPSAGLAKLLWLQQHYADAPARYGLHQADWVAGRLCGRFGVSDANNCLKLGYDPVTGTWPDWLDALHVKRELLPTVLAPGTPIGELTEAAAADLGLCHGIAVVAGTTDSTAAFLATGASSPGEAVTSLGSTLVMKVLTPEPLFAPEYGVYSQPFGQLWLAGGGSNTGGAVLRHFFDDARLGELTQALEPETPTQLDYYPLLEPGERFPVCDPNLSPRLAPRPDDDRLFFQGMLEAMARIEHQGYRRLAELGTPYPHSVRSVGGGAKNRTWIRIRGQELGVAMVEPPHQDAAFGTATLAKNRRVP